MEKWLKKKIINGNMVKKKIINGNMVKKKRRKFGKKNFKNKRNINLELWGLPRQINHENSVLDNFI